MMRKERKGNMEKERKRERGEGGEREIKCMKPLGLLAFRHQILYHTL